MFDIGFSELVVIGVVALIVLGPERLPRVARTAGMWIGKLQRYATAVKADIEREIQLEELRQLEAKIREQRHAFEEQMRAEVTRLEEVVQSPSSNNHSEIVSHTKQEQQLGSEGSTPEKR